ncbi:unnamed protein product, partial [Rotaria sordida]
GTHIMEGSGKMLVLAVGEHSQTGMILKLLCTTKEQNNDKKKTNNKKKQNATTSQNVVLDNVNPTSNEDDLDCVKIEKHSILHTQLRKLGTQIEYAGIAIVILTVLVLLVSFSIEQVIQQHEWDYKYWTRIVGYLITCIIVFVLAVPVDLSSAITLSLTYVAKKMMNDNNLVRHLDACETVGNITTIFSNKTEILTMNHMTVVQIYVGEKYWKNIENSIKTKEIIIPANTKEILFESVSVNSSYSSILLVS